MKRSLSASYKLRMSKKIVLSESDFEKSMAHITYTERRWENVLKGKTKEINVIME